MSVPDGSAASTSSSTSTGNSGGSRQEYGTLWIQDQNGVAQMVRVMQATPSRSGEGASPTVRALVRPTGSGVRVLGQPALVQPARRTALQLAPGAHAVGSPGGPRRLLVATRRPATPKRRVLPSGPRAPNSPSPLHLSPLASPALDRDLGAGKRPAHDMWSDSKRARHADKCHNGLRHFSMKVCEKVRAKGKTTYNEVADELVCEYADVRACDSAADQPYDQKNIRRRVYDALNVLMAMHIISKEKKEIRWLGLPSNALHDCRQLERDRAERLRRIGAKTQQLKELLLQQVAFKRLVERNREAERLHGPPPPGSTVQLPFIVVNTDKRTVIDCSISNDKMEYLFNFSDIFEIHDDVEVLKRMGLSLGLERGGCSPEQVKQACSLVPPAMAPYIEMLGREGAVEGSGSQLQPSEQERSMCVTPSIDVDSDDDDEDTLMEHGDL